MADQTSQVPDPAERAEINAALHATGADTGFRDDHGRSAPWPDDIDEWRRATSGAVEERRTPSMITANDSAKSDWTRGKRLRAAT
jgi:hypothetical protein